MVEHGTERHGKARHSYARHDTAWPGLAQQHGTARNSPIRPGAAPHGTARRRALPHRPSILYNCSIPADTTSILDDDRALPKHRWSILSCNRSTFNYNQPIIYPGRPIPYYSRAIIHNYPVEPLLHAVVSVFQPTTTTTSIRSTRRWQFNK